MLQPLDAEAGGGVLAGAKGEAGFQRDVAEAGERRVPGEDYGAAAEARGGQRLLRLDHPLFGRFVVVEGRGVQAEGGRFGEVEVGADVHEE